MKKVLATFIIGIIACCGVISLTACDNDGGDNASATADDSSATVTATATASATASDTVTSRTENIEDFTYTQHWDGTYTITGVKDQSVTEVVIPNTVTEIDQRAFYHCSGLTSIVIPDSVLRIGQNAFASCSALTSVTLGRGITHVETSAFTFCDALAQVNYGGNVEDWCKIVFDNEYANPLMNTANINFNGESIENVVIPASVEGISNFAFVRCNTFTSVTISNGVETIGEQAFAGCARVENISIPESVNSIGASAFSNCVSLNSITVSSDNGEYCSVNGNLYSKDVKTLLQYAIGKADTAFVVPNDVTIIEQGALLNATKLTSITLSDALVKIGQGAFVNCIGLTSITIPGNVTEIGMMAFYPNTSLTSVVFENSTGWQARIYGGGYTAIDVSDSAQNAVNLTGDYILAELKRT